MKHFALRRVSAIAVTAALLLTTVFSISIFANAATFSPRLTAPARTNKYYYSDKNIYYASGWGMPNCTAYAYGRAYEILGKEPKLSWYSAETWYDYNRNGGYYNYGRTPKVGAIACWCYNGGGHVAVVEQINSDGSMVLSNSGYNYLEFYLTYANKNDSNPGGNSWWTFQGYIYIIDSADVVDSEPAVEYKNGVYKVQVDSTLNMRSGAGTSNAYVTSVPNGAKLSVTQTKQAGGYTWGYTTYNNKSGWVALDYCVYVSEIPEETKAPATQPATQPATKAPATQPATKAPATQPATKAPATQPATKAPVTQPATKAPATQPATKAPVTQPATKAPATQPTKAPVTQPVTKAPATVATQKPVATTAPVTVPAPAKKKGLGIGDINSDGVISISDATMIQKYLSDSITLTSEQVGWCDFNFDGRVTIDDVTGIQRYASLKYD